MLNKFETKKTFTSGKFLVSVINTHHEFVSADLIKKFRTYSNCLCMQILSNQGLSDERYLRLPITQRHGNLQV